MSAKKAKLQTKDLRLGGFYVYKGKVVQLVTIDKRACKRHSTVRLIVEEQGNPKWRRIVRAPSKLEEA